MTTYESLPSSYHHTHSDSVSSTSKPKSTNNKDKAMKLPSNGLDSPVPVNTELQDAQQLARDGDSENSTLIQNTSTSLSRLLNTSSANIDSDNFRDRFSLEVRSFYHKYVSSKLALVPNDDLTNNNIVGWYFYMFSSEPFIVSVVGTYMPILLQSYARSNAVLSSNHNVHCPLSGKESCVLGLFDNRVFIDTASYALYTFSLSVFFQMLTVISISGLVDVYDVSIRFKKQILLAAGVLGSVSTIVVSFSTASNFYILAFLSILTNCCYGVINVVGNSLLPVIVTSYFKKEGESDTVIESKYSSEELTTIVSGRGSSIGYMSALVVQVICIFIISGVAGNTLDPEDNTMAMKIAVLFVGVWWFVWQIPMVFFLKDYDTEAESGLVEKKQLTMKILARYTRKSWTSLYDSIKHASLLKDVMIFLVGWFIISDSITTINSTAMLFSKTELSMTTINLVVVSILTLIFAIIGAFFVPQFITSTLGKKSNQSMIYVIIWASFIPLYGIAGFYFKNFGLRHKMEMYILAVWYGISLGALNAISRSIFSLIIPPGKESTFFSLFSITDKGSSIVGPTLVGLLTDRTHNIRYSFYLLFALLLLSLPFFSLLDVDRGKREAISLSCVIQERLEHDESVYHEEDENIY